MSMTEEIQRDYIRERYKEEGIIPKEIYQYYSQVPKEKINDIIHDACQQEQVLYRIENSRIERPLPSLIQTKQISKENESVDQIIIEYENLPTVTSFTIPYIDKLINLPVTFWKTVEMGLIESVLDTIENLYLNPFKTRNYRLVRGYFGGQYVILIIMPQTMQVIKSEIREDVPMMWLEQEKYRPNKLSMIIDTIGNRLDEYNSTYRLKCRYIIVDDDTWNQVKSLQKNYEYTRGTTNCCFLPIDGTDGFVLECPNAMIIPGAIIIRTGRDLVRQIDFQRYGIYPKENKLIKVQDFKTPIIRKMTILKKKETKPKSAFKPMGYNRAIFKHLNKWMKYDRDREYLSEIYPYGLYDRISYKVENPERKFRVNVIEKILIELDNINK